MRCASFACPSIARAISRFIRSSFGSVGICAPRIAGNETRSAATIFLMVRHQNSGSWRPLCAAVMKRPQYSRLGTTSTRGPMHLSDLVLTSRLVGDTSARLEKITLLAALLKRLAPNEIPIAVGFLTGWPCRGKLGVGWASVAEARTIAGAVDPTLDLVEVDRAFTAIKAARGKGRKALLAELLTRATTDEQSFLGAL